MPAESSPSNLFVESFKLKAQPLRDQFAGADSLPLLTLLGPMTGIIDGAVIVGMGAMMGTSLNAPLAATIAIVEFTDDNLIICMIYPLVAMTRFALMPMQIYTKHLNS